METTIKSHAGTNIRIHSYLIPKPIMGNYKDPVLQANKGSVVQRKVIAVGFVEGGL